VGSCDEPLYEFETESDTESDSESELPQKSKRVHTPSHESDSESELPQKARRVLSPRYESDSESVNEDLYYTLFQIAEKEENIHKKAAFKKAAESIYNLPYKVRSGTELSSGPKKVAGIGKTIAHMVDEYITTGKITRGGESTNHKMATAFDTLATLLNQDEYKSMAYKNAAEIVRNFKGPITSGKELSEGPKKVKGIGKSIGKMIDEFLSTGRLSKIQELVN